MNYLKFFVLAALSAALIACGGSDDNGGNAQPTPDPTAEPTPEPTPDPTPEPTPVPGSIVGPFSTGSVSEPSYVYFDFETGTQLALSEEEAAASDDWDIAFRRAKLFLNFNATTPVTAYFTNNNADFFDGEGEPIADAFTQASPESELADFIAVTAADVPADSEFSSDSESLTIGDKFYSYDYVNHVVSAADDKYFLVYSDGNFSKLRAKAIATEGRTIASITLGIALQDVGAGDTEFMAETDLVIDAVACTGDIYIDQETQQQVSESDAWDYRMPCITVEENTGAGFEIHVAEDAMAREDSAEGYTGIDADAVAYYSFEPNLKQNRFFDEHLWYEYGLAGGHLLWSQYGVYLIKTATSTYKFQITSYYDTEGTSGNYSFRFEAL